MGWTTRDRGSILAMGKVSPPKASRLAVGPNGTLYADVKQPGLKINPSRPRGAEIKNVWSYTSIHPYVFLAWRLEMTGTSLPSSCINSIETDNKNVRLSR